MLRRTSAALAVLSAVATGFVWNITTASAAGSGSFSVLTYNVAGLPAAVNSATTAREPSSTQIGERIKPFDVVNVQEDFNYHKDLYASDTHPDRTSTSGGAGFGSGLNTLSNFPYTGFDRNQWSSCHGTDCLTPKGFTFMRVNVADGVTVDFYNLHSNAGDASADLSARRDNLTQLSAYIKEHSAENAVVVMGDTNTRYTRTGDNIAQFASDNGLTDAWVQLQRNGTPPAAGSTTLLCDPKAVTNDCEVVDKVLYRSSSALTLQATAYDNQHTGFLDSSGGMLSDHDPVSVQFSWTQN